MPCPSTGSKIVFASPNFLSQTKINLDIVPVQKNLCHTKRYLHLVTSVLVLAQIFWSGIKCNSIFALAKNIWTSSKHFGTYRRTRHNFTCMPPKLNIGRRCCSSKEHFVRTAMVSSMFISNQWVVESGLPPLSETD